MSQIFKKSEQRYSGVATHVFEKIADRRTRRRRAEDRSAENAREAGYRKGLEEGKRIGLEEGRSEVRPLIESLGAILDEMSGYRGEIIAGCEREVVELCLSIARKVVQRELETREDSVVYLVKEALRAAVTNGKIKVRLNPADMEIVLGLESELESYTKAFSGVEFLGDDDVSRGGCVVDTGCGEVDATIDGLFEEVEGLLKGN